MDEIPHGDDSNGKEKEGTPTLLENQASQTVHSAQNLVEGIKTKLNAPCRGHDPSLRAGLG